MTKTAIIFGHPLHEMASIGWMSQWKPDVLYLTKADAGGDLTREQSTRETLTELKLGGSFRSLGLSEKVLFERMMAGDDEWFESIIEQIADWLKVVRPAILLSDGYEWFNPTHDLCPLLADCACHRAGIQIQRRYELPLAYVSAGAVEDADVDFPIEVVRLKREQEQLKRAYVDRLMDLEQEAAKVVQGLPHALFKNEFLRQIPTRRDYSKPPAPGNWRTYDAVGRERVASGKYARTIEFDAHFRPLALKLMGRWTRSA